MESCLDPLNGCKTRSNAFLAHLSRPDKDRILELGEISEIQDSQGSVFAYAPQ